MDSKSRLNFYRSFRDALDEYGFGWAIRDWKAGFHYWDANTDAPVPGMREALMRR